MPKAWHYFLDFKSCEQTPDLEKRLWCTAVSTFPKPLGLDWLTESQWAWIINDIESMFKAERTASLIKVKLSSKVRPTCNEDNETSSSRRLCETAFAALPENSPCASFAQWKVRRPWATEHLFDQRRATQSLPLFVDDNEQIRSSYYRSLKWKVPAQWPSLACSDCQFWAWEANSRVWSTTYKISIVHIWGNRFLRLGMKSRSA